MIAITNKMRIYSDKTKDITIIKKIIQLLMLSRGRERRDVVWRRRMLLFVPLVWGVVCWEGFLDLIIELWLMFKSRHLVLWSLGTYGLRKSE